MDCNRNKLIRLFVVMVLILCGLISACVRTPDVKKENGISYAVDKENQDIANIIENEEPELSQSTDKSCQSTCRIGNAKDVMNIMATVSGMNVNTVSYSKASSFSGMVDKEKVKELFFGGKVDMAEKNKNNKEEKQKGEKATIRQFETTGMFSYDK